MTSFRQRPPVPIGILGLVVLTLLTLAAYNFDDLPIIGGGTTYTAQFSEAAGLQSGDAVYIAGVEAGRVTAVELAGDRVSVSFRIDDAWVGDQTRAAIQLESLLGAKSLGLDPRGDRVLDPDRPIPLERTTAPFDVVEAFNGLSRTLEDIDITQLDQSLQVLADTFRDTPDEVSGALDGLSRLSRTIAGRDDELARLLANTRTVSGVLASRNAEFEQLVIDANLLLDEVAARREAISALLTSTQAFAAQLRGLVADNAAALRPALEQLDRVAAVLQRNQDNLDRALELEAVFVRVFGNALGTGRWFDNYTCGLLLPPNAVGPVQLNEDGCRPPISGPAGRGDR
ncbi:MAG: MCE family protein [Actinomycetota bacterium]|nr:MCE family protein [Actinomycetota bacterium]